MQKMEKGRFGEGNEDGNHFEMLTIHCNVILSQYLLFMMPKWTKKTQYRWDKTELETQFLREIVEEIDHASVQLRKLKLQ